MHFKRFHFLNLTSVKKKFSCISQFVSQYCTKYIKIINVFWFYGLLGILPSVYTGQFMVYTESTQTDSGYIQNLNRVIWCLHWSNQGRHRVTHGLWRVHCRTIKEAITNGSNFIEFQSFFCQHFFFSLSLPLHDHQQ